MTTYRLLALDMDGTVLNSHKRVSAATREALQGLANRGVALALATGRNVIELSDYADELAFIPFGVLASGAIAYDFEHGQALASTPLDPAAAQTAIKTALAEGGHPFLSCVDRTRARACDIEALTSCGLAEYQLLYQRVCEQVDDLLVWMDQHPRKVVKLDIYHEDPQGCLRIRDALASSGMPLEVWSSEPGCMECTARGVNKAVGLNALADSLDINMDEVVAVGDGGNDLAMLKAVGCAVAMGNAQPSVREVADLTVADNDHDGIVELVQTLF